MADGIMGQRWNDRQSGIYEIRNTATGKRYIGSAESFYYRWKQHLTKLGQNKHHSRRLQHAWNKYGEAAFEFRIIERISDLALLIEREQFWLDFYRPWEDGYNICPVAQSVRGITRRQETKDKIRAAHIGMRPTEETRKKLSAVHAARIVSKETRDKQRTICLARDMGYNRGKVMPEDQREKIRAGMNAVVFARLSPDQQAEYHTPTQVAKRAIKRQRYLRERERKAARKRNAVRLAEAAE